MQNAIDTLVTYLAAELAGQLGVAYIRLDAANPRAGELQAGKLNVQVLDGGRDWHVGSALVSLDLIGTNERTTWAWAKAVEDVLLSSTSIPEYDYTGSPTLTGSAVFWNFNDVAFRVIGKNNQFVQLTCTLPIKFAS